MLMIESLQTNKLMIKSLLRIQDVVYQTTKIVWWRNRKTCPGGQVGRTGHII